MGSKIRHMLHIPKRPWIEHGLWETQKFSWLEYECSHSPTAAIRRRGCSRTKVSLSCSFIRLN